MINFLYGYNLPVTAANHAISLLGEQVSSMALRVHDLDSRTLTQQCNDQLRVAFFLLSFERGRFRIEENVANSRARG